MIRAAFLVMVAIAAGACGGSSPSSASVVAHTSVLPVPVSTELAVGPNRYLFSFLDAASNSPAGRPDRTASVGFSGPSGATIPAVTGSFAWAIEGASGIYIAHANFPVPGSWTAHFTTSVPGQAAESMDFGFDVLEHKHVISPGDPAPSVTTPTIESAGGDVRSVSTDASPDPAFYRRSIADALAERKPFVLVFATPKFCKTSTCGPTLDKVKAVARAHPAITFINVEPYLLTPQDGQLQPVLDGDRQLQEAPATRAYGLLSEPYVFVVGADGVVSSSFELIFTTDEIDAALAAVGAP